MPDHCEHSPLKDMNLLTKPSITSEPVKVVVGSSRKTYFMHEAQLCASSDFFKKAFNADWKEKETRIIALPEASPGVFGVYAKWLYSGRFYLAEQDDIKYDEKRNLHIDGEYLKVLRCYTLADFLQDNDFKDASIDIIVKKIANGNHSLADLAQTVYAHSTAQSPHRQLIVDCAIQFWSKTEFRFVGEADYPNQFLTDLIVSRGPYRRSLVCATPTWLFVTRLNNCKYHEHTKNNTPCYKAKLQNPL